MKEAQFNSEIMKSLKAHKDTWAYKISDSPTSWTMDRTRFTPDKPCDIVACIGGVFVAIECKQIKKWEAFGMRHLRDVQQANLEKVSKSGGESYVFLNVRIKAVKGKSKHEDRLIIFQWSVFKKLTDTGSIKAKDLQALPFTAKKNEVYDLTEFRDILAWI